MILITVTQAPIWNLPFQSFNHPLNFTIQQRLVGRATPGAVVASRLSEDPKASVLLLEAGPHSLEPATAIPAACGTCLGDTVSLRPWPRKGASLLRDLIC